jgi:hypothetical protein
MDCSLSQAIWIFSILGLFIEPPTSTTSRLNKGWQRLGKLARQIREERKTEIQKGPTDKRTDSRLVFYLSEKIIL